MEHEDKNTVLEEEEVDEKESKVALIYNTMKKFKYGSSIMYSPVPTVFIPPKSNIRYYIVGSLFNFDLLFKVNNIDNSLERLLQVYRFLASALHSFPVLEKPLNSILGETRMGNFHTKDENGMVETENYYCSELVALPQTMATCVYNKKQGVKVLFNYEIDLLFLGTNVKVENIGKTTIILEKFNEVYEYNSPSLNSRFLRGFTEFSGDSILSSSDSKYKMNIKYGEKPILGGHYNKVDIEVIDIEKNEKKYNITGTWSGEMVIKDLKTKESKLFYKRLKETTMIERNEDTSLPTNSYNVWKEVFDAHHRGNSKQKRLEKLKVEKQQEKQLEERKKNNIEWTPKHFYKNETIGTWDLLNH
ncbi:hypothetical protein DICPUDRAFT_74116 [Dictyostelium purpureum]|uniref:Oxysterol binding family protein n=1 Tax=Dictyostelium purpureum TaxID=5786 RepID=F0Z6P3_DICPU|nr:uncharacterized protein DICPUDRAFT_74116 [Dictyostelium purpureum]EGC40395.1 hypothetical protein DICPUDRAFT_74116 [Dictyostelium purpureum]|eukprot:XP_003283146.1 hypothetical protein DICPUDRAFT_74116 [Dictyostelium purpureum]